MWVAIRKIAGKTGKEYLPGDAIPEASGWRNPRIWTRWIKQVPDAEVVGGRWTRYEEVMLRGAKPAAKPATPSPAPSAPAPVAPEPLPDPTPAEAKDSAPADEERPTKRRRRSVF